MSALPETTDAPEIRDPLTVVTDALAPAEGIEWDSPSIPGDGEPWSITDRTAAEWAIAKMVQADILHAERTSASVAAIEALEAEIARHRDYIDHCAVERDRTQTFFSIHLTAWLRRMRQEDGAEGLPESKVVKSIRLAHGVVKSLRKPDAVLVVDDDAFCALHGDDSEFVRVTRKPAKDAIREHVKVSGIAPAGATIERGEVEYSVELSTPAVSP